MNNPMLPLPGLSPVSGRKVVVKFDGGLLSSDGGVLALREIEHRLRIIRQIAITRGKLSPVERPAVKECGIGFGDWSALVAGVFPCTV